MSVEELKYKARLHWEKWLPESVKEWKADGRLNERMQVAAVSAQEEIERLVRVYACRPHEAEEAALKNFILLPPEGDGLEDWEREELAEMDREYQANPPVPRD